MEHVVVIGGGFAGLMALKQLIKSKNLKLTLINKDDYFLFTPRLTELLNDSISNKIVIKDIKKIFGSKINFVKGMAKFIDFREKYVQTGNKKIDYDYLIMSQGASTDYFGNKNIENKITGYKNYDVILKIKSKIKSNIQKYSKTKEKKLLTFVVIGAGLTGTELICSLRETVLKEIKKYSNINAKDAKFILMQSDSKIVPQLPDKARLIVEKQLKKGGIEIITKARIKKVVNGKIINKNSSVKASTIIWTAGVKANTIKTNPKIKLDNYNKIKVTGKLKIPDYENVYFAGDISIFMENNKPLAATAQVAFLEGINIGKNILRKIHEKNEEDFHYVHKGTMIVLGSKCGLFTYKNITFSGKLAWYFRHLAYKYRFSQIT
jgi:NADH:ubiquinone reductase (H+-translocating)